MAHPNVTWKKIACFSQNALKVMHFMFFSRSGLVHDHPMPVGTTVNGQCYCALLQDKVRPALHHKQPELPEHGVILLQDNAILQCHDVQNLVQHQGLDMLPHAPYSPDFIPCYYWLVACVKENLWSKQIESEDDSNTAVNVSLYHLSTDEYRAAIDRLPHTWEKCVTMLVIILSRRCV